MPALVAQSVEQLTLNQRVVGSSPTGGTFAKLKPRETPGFFRGLAETSLRAIFEDTGRLSRALACVGSLAWIGQENGDRRMQL